MEKTFEVEVLRASSSDALRMTGAKFFAKAEIVPCLRLSVGETFADCWAVMSGLLISASEKMIRLTPAIAESAGHFLRKRMIIFWTEFVEVLVFLIWTGRRDSRL